MPYNVSAQTTAWRTCKLSCNRSADGSRVFWGGRGSTRQICRRPSESLVLVGVWFVGTTRRASQEASTQKKGHKESRDDKLLFLLLSSAEIMTLCIYLENTCCGLDHDDTKTPFFSTGLLPQYRQMTKSSLVYLDCGC